MIFVANFTAGDSQSLEVSSLQLSTSFSFILSSVSIQCIHTCTSLMLYIRQPLPNDNQTNNKSKGLEEIHKAVRSDLLFKVTGSQK